MHKVLFAAAIALAGLANAPAQAMEIAPLPASAPAVTLVSGGCGIGFHRGPYGGCRPNGYGGVVVGAPAYGYRGVYGVHGAYGYHGGGMAIMGVMAITAATAITEATDITAGIIAAIMAATTTAEENDSGRKSGASDVGPFSRFPPAPDAEAFALLAGDDEPRAPSWGRGVPCRASGSGERAEAPSPASRRAALAPRHTAHPLVP